MELLKKSNGSWNVPATMTWSNSGSGTVYIDQSYGGLSYGYYRLSAAVDVYDPNGLLCESVTEYSRIAYYNAEGVVYYF